MTASSEPAYNKPDAPGIRMGFDNVVSIYHVVDEADDFQSAAAHVFGMIKEAQERYPDWPRVFYLDVNGHKGDRAGFDADFFEFQQEFLIAGLGPFLTALDMPLVSVWNPEPQRNDLPDALAVE
ncbi:MAG TPA: hypothetical protein VMO47_06075 [Rhodothermales bacterium]|nr:hypothetical protein [Rhodothermales bacterium]